MNINSTVPSSSEVSGDMTPRCGWVMINDIFYCDFAQEPFSLMIAMAWTSSVLFPGIMIQKLTSAKLSVFVFISMYALPAQHDQRCSNGKGKQVLII